MSEVTFTEMPHEYRVAGVVVPHVTGVLADLEDWFGVAPSVLEYASERGKLVHLATQMLDEGDLDEDSIDPVIAPFLAAYRQFKADAAPEWEGIEERVYHEQYGYCGTLDRRGVLKAVKGSPECILDLKCVATISPATGVQTSAYDAAAPKTRKKRQRYALQLKPNGQYLLKRYDDPSDWAVFTSLLNVHQWARRHGRQENYTS
jgi:hypothetical protein